MRLHCLGVSGPYPASLGATSGYLLGRPGIALLQLDFGSGVLGRLTALCPPEDLSAVLLSHWHFDHAGDLLPLIYRLQALGGKPCPCTPRWMLPPRCGKSQRSWLLPILTDRGPETCNPWGMPGSGWAKPGIRCQAWGTSCPAGEIPGLYRGYQHPSFPARLFPKCGSPAGRRAVSRVGLGGRQAASFRGAGRRPGRGRRKALVLTHLNPGFPPERCCGRPARSFPTSGWRKAGAVISL